MSSFLCLRLAAWRLSLEACRLGLAACCNQYGFTVPRTPVRAAGAAGSARSNLLLYLVWLGIQDGFHYFHVLVCRRDHEAGVANNGASIRHNDFLKFVFIVFLKIPFTHL